MIQQKANEFHVEMVGHASLRMQYGGKTMLTDPWYVDPIDCNTQFHWPPLVHDVAQLAKETDAIWVSHIHPDHFDPRTLEQFPRHIPIYIGEYANKEGFRNKVKALGFTVHEVPFQTLVPVEGTEFKIAILESDYLESAAFDSSALFQTPSFTLFNNNDCFLKDHKYEWVRDNFKVDYGFLGFSPASYYPICFEFDAEEKKQLLQKAADRRYNDFLSVAGILKPKIAVPFAMGIRFLQQQMIWKNAQFNSSFEAARRAEARGQRAAVLMPGDSISPDGDVRRGGHFISEADEPKALLAHAEKLKPWIEQVWASEAPAQPDLIPRFRNWMTQLWERCESQFPEVKTNVIAYRIDGPHGGSFYFDFSRDPKGIFVPGEPLNFDMRYSYADRMLQQRLDGKIDWDELHFSNRVSVGQRKYAPEFYAMIRSAEGSKLVREIAGK